MALQNKAVADKWGIEMLFFFIIKSLNKSGVRTNEFMLLSLIDSSLTDIFSPDEVKGLLKFMDGTSYSPYRMFMGLRTKKLIEKVGANKYTISQAGRALLYKMEQHKQKALKNAT